jgi:hypothetical protein
MAWGKLIEKPDGARNVVAWDVHASRAYHPVYTLGGDRFAYDSPSGTTVEITVQFDDDASATEFEHRVRAMLPEVAP